MSWDNPCDKFLHVIVWLLVVFYKLIGGGGVISLEREGESDWSEGAA